MQTSLTPIPFAIPSNVACISDLPGTENSPISVPLSSIDATTLDNLCTAFRHEVFTSAGAVDPKVGA